MKLLLPWILLLPSSSVIVVQATSSSSSIRKLDHDGHTEMIAKYKPLSVVVNENALDLDQQLMIESLINNGFDIGLQVYENGAHSYPKAKLKLNPPLSSPLSKGAIVEGFTTSEQEVIGTVLNDYDVGDTTIEIEYGNRGEYDDHTGIVKCQVGGNPNPVTTECFKATGRILVEDQRLSYTYNITGDNSARYSLKWLSDSARSNYYECNDEGDTCPYDDFDLYYKYYGKFDYADEWILSAAKGVDTPYDNSVGFFSQLDVDGRIEAMKLGTVYLSFFMAILGEMEKALDACNTQTQSGNGVFRWDRAVAFYVGSLEGENGDDNGFGVLMYAQANQLCQQFNTCGDTSNDNRGLSYVNEKVMEHFAQGQDALTKGDCGQVVWPQLRIIEMMTVPIVQTILLHSYARSTGLAGADGRVVGAGAAATAALLPYLNDCNADDAEFLYDQMRIDKSVGDIDFAGIKSTLEKNYDCLRIHCQEVGGIYDTATKSYFAGASPCKSDTKLKNKNKTSGGDGDVNVGLAIGLAVGGAALLCIVVMIASYCGVKPAPAPSGLSADEGEMT